MKRNLLVAHAAGILDGEGCFSIMRQGNTFFIKVKVAMTAIQPLKRLVGLFGGSLVALTGDPSHKNQVYQYTVSCKQANRLVSEVFPYLIEKREQAKLLLSLQSNINQYKVGRGPGNPVPDEIMKLRQDLLDRCKLLKRHPPIDVPKEISMDKREAFSYIAGYLEAEGCFGIFEHKKRYFHTRISVGVPCLATLKYLNKIFGGDIREDKKSNLYTWSIFSNQAADICRKCFVYFSFKKEEATLLRMFQNNINLYAKRFGPGNNIPDEVMQKRVLWQNRIHEIHKFGRAETKSGQPYNPYKESDSPICNELLIAGA